MILQEKKKMKINNKTILAWLGAIATLITAIAALMGAFKSDKITSGNQPIIEQRFQGGDGHTVTKTITIESTRTTE